MTKGNLVANQVGWWEITGGDGKTLPAFYSSLFGWRMDANNPMNYAMVNEDAGVGGGIGGASPDGHHWVTIYIEVDDVQAALDKAVSLGGKVVNPPMDVPGGPTIAHFADPAGNFVGVMKNSGQGGM